MKNINEILLGYHKWDDLLWKNYFKTFKDVDYTITDGVVDPAMYARCSFRIMPLNREPWDDDEYSLNEALCEGIKKGSGVWKKQSNLRKRLREYFAVIKFCVDSKSFTPDECLVRGYVESTTEDDFLQMLLNTAYLNVKKSDGKAVSRKSDLKEYAQKGIFTLKEQIRFLNPSIILGGNVVDGILDQTPLEWGENLYTKKGVINIFQLKIDDKLYAFVDMKHPSAWVGMEDYYMEFFRAIKQVEIDHPGFWESRMNLDCFTDSHIL